MCNGFGACTSLLDVCCSSSSAQLAAAKFYGVVFEVSGGDFLVDGSNASIQFKVHEETTTCLAAPENAKYSTLNRSMFCHTSEVTRDHKAVLLTSSTSTANLQLVHMIRVHSIQVQAGFYKHTLSYSQ